MLPFIERRPLLSGLQLGQDATPDDLIIRMDKAGIGWYDEVGTKDVIRCIKLQDPGTADAYAICVGEVNDADWTRRDAFQSERSRLGFGLVAQELACLAAITIQERLNRGEDPGVKTSVWYIGDSGPVVGAYGRRCVLRFFVRDGRVFVYWDYGDPGSKWSRVDQFLCSRK